MLMPFVKQLFVSVTHFLMGPPVWGPEDLALPSMRSLEREGGL